MQRPLSIKLFALLFGFATLVALLLALYAVNVAEFGARIRPEAAATLAARITMIRLVGIGFAVSLMLFVLFGRSAAARGALGVRWVMSFTTSIVFLRVIGVIAPVGDSGMAATALSVIQLGAEGLAILILHGPDAAPWFERPLPHLSVDHPRP